MLYGQVLKLPIYYFNHNTCQSWKIQISEIYKHLQVNQEYLQKKSIYNPICTQIIENHNIVKV